MRRVASPPSLATLSRTEEDRPVTNSKNYYGLIGGVVVILMVLWLLLVQLGEFAFW